MLVGGLSGSAARARGYYLRIPIHVEPGGQLVSRLARETSGQLYIPCRGASVGCVFAAQAPVERLLLKAKTLLHQLQAPRKRRRISENLKLLCDERQEILGLCLADFPR